MTKMSNIHFSHDYTSVYGIIILEIAMKFRFGIIKITACFCLCGGDFAKVRKEKRRNYGKGKNKGAFI